MELREQTWATYTTVCRISDRSKIDQCMCGIKDALDCRYANDIYMWIHVHVHVYTNTHVYECVCEKYDGSTFLRMMNMRANHKLRTRRLWVESK